MTESQTLLGQYVTNGSEPAFRELVTRYIDLVYSTALRLVDHQSQLAEDVAQTVFIALAQKARTLPASVMLGGWLHHHTRFVAAKMMRGERRRQNREREAAEMSRLEDYSKANLDQIAPILDEAIGELGAADRAAILLRFFEQGSFQAVGDALGVSDEAARKRVNAALDRLHLLLKRRGVTLSATALATGLAAEAVTTAPAWLANNVAGVALASTATSGGMAATLTTLMTWTKLKVGIAVLLLALGLATLVPYRLTNTFKNPIRNRATSKVNSSSTGQATGFYEAPLRIISADELERAKRDLRLLLDRAQSSRRYPPPELRHALTNFGNQWLQALPILLEYLDNPDFETRHWSLSAISDLVNSREGKDADSLNEALAQFRPKVSAIFRSSGQPVDLRRLAFQSLAQIHTNVPSTPRSLEPEMLADITSVLQSAQKKFLGFRFEVLDALSTPRMRNYPENVQMLREALDPLLQKDDSGQRFLAAYGLAVLPGEKSSELKEIFLHALDLRENRDASNTYRAAEGLGRLGSQAKDAVPALLAFAKETKDWASGYADSALKAACLIQPDLRQQYPSIDANLREEETAAQADNGAPRIITITSSEMAATLSNSGSAPKMVKSFTDQIRESDEPAQTKTMILRMLDRLLAQSTEPQHEGIQKTIDAVRSGSGQKPDQNTQPLPLINLTLDARILLLNGSHGGETRLSSVIADWDEFYRKNPFQSTLTSERFEGLSKSIKEIDPAFHRQWVEAILNNYPTLDRIINVKK